MRPYPSVRQFAKSSASLRSAIVFTLSSFEFRAPRRCSAGKLSCSDFFSQKSDFIAQLRARDGTKRFRHSPHLKRVFGDAVPVRRSFELRRRIVFLGVMHPSPFNCSSLRRVANSWCGPKQTITDIYVSSCIRATTLTTVASHIAHSVVKTIALTKKRIQAKATVKGTSSWAQYLGAFRHAQKLTQPEPAARLDVAAPRFPGGIPGGRFPASKCRSAFRTASTRGK